MEPCGLLGRRGAGQTGRESRLAEVWLHFMTANSACELLFHLFVHAIVTSISPGRSSYTGLGPAAFLKMAFTPAM